jgi:hypothetical protein
MDLQEQVTALNAEKKQYLQIIDNLNAEKIALDQMLVSNLKESLTAKKDLILSNANLKNELSKIERLEKEKEDLSIQLMIKKNEIDKLLSSSEINVE